MPLAATKSEDVAMFRNAGIRSLGSSPAVLDLPHVTLDGQSDDGAPAPWRWLGELEGSKGHAPSALAARPSLESPAASAAVADVIAPSSAVLSELRRRRDVLRYQVRQAKAVLARRGEAASTLDGARGLRGGGAPVGAAMLPGAIALLSAAGPSSRALSRLEELRDALSELVDEAKVGRAR